MTAPRRAGRAARSAAPLLEAKLNRPNPGGHQLERPHLVRALIQHADRPLTMVVADAGWGKTTLLASAAAAVPRPVVWYSLMPSDAEPLVFCRYLLAGFRRERPRFGRDLERALAEARPGRSGIEMLAGTLLRAVADLDGPPWWLVLDDLHEVSGSAPLTALLDTLVRHLPPTLRIAIATRTPPPLPLERLRARGELFELDSSHLRFARDELARLFGEVYGHPLAEADVEALEQATVGWPTAAHLVHEALRRGPDRSLEQVLTELRSAPLGLDAWLSAEVVRRLEPEAGRLLERTAALARFDAALATTLSGVRDARPRLDGLVRRGLLSSFGTGDDVSYAWHDLVRRTVRREREERDGADAWRALEADTGLALRARGEHERALPHLIAGGRHDEAAELLRGLAAELLAQGRAATLLERLDDLPAARLDADLALFVARADAHQALGHFDDAATRYEQALERARVADAPEVECRALLGLGKVLNLRGQHERVLGMAERGLAGATRLPALLRGRLLQMKASAHFYLGQYGAAVALLDQVRPLAAEAGPELMLPTLHNLAVALAARGDYREAAREFRVALAQVRGGASPRAALYLSNLALLLTELGELAEARRAAEEGIEAARRFTNRAQEVAALEALGHILLQSGDPDGALAALKRAEELNAELRLELLAADLLALRGRFFCARGQWQRGAEYFGQAIERLAERADAPRLIAFRATLAWCELRSARPHAALERLRALVAETDRGENGDHRMRVHYWLAEALLARGAAREATAHLRDALAIARDKGYRYFLRVQAGEEPAPLLHALSEGVELDVVAAALAEAGPAVEEPLLARIGKAPVPVAEAALSVLAEVGGALTSTGLADRLRGRRALQPALRTTLKRIEERAQRVAPAAADERHVRIVAFGPPRIEVEGEPIAASAWRTRRSFLLLLHLALSPRGLSRDELLEAFWPGRQAALGRRNFHPTLSFARSVLPRAAVAPLLREGDRYRLHPDYPFTCDAWEVEAALEAARRAGSPAERRVELERAVALADRPLLEGIYADWADEAQRRMRDRMEKAHLDLGRVLADAGETERALTSFRRASELDPFRESTRVDIAACLVRIGNRGAAVVEMDRLRTLLRDELGVEPMPETAQALERLLSATEPRNGRTSQPQEPEVVAAGAQAGLKGGSRS